MKTENELKAELATLTKKFNLQMMLVKQERERGNLELMHTYLENAMITRGQILMGQWVRRPGSAKTYDKHYYRA